MKLFEIFIPFIVVVGAFSISSCSPKIYERVIVQHDTTYLSKMQIDSVYKRDSIYIKEKADTIFQYIERIRERYRLIHDTTIVTKVDSVAYETIKEVKVEKPLSWSQRTKIGAFWWLLGGLLASLLYIFRKPILALLRKFLI